MAKAKKQQSDLSAEVKATTEQLLQLVGVNAEVVVEETTDQTTDQKTIQVNIDSTSETGLLIGTHGSTLNAIQVFLGMAVRQFTGDWVRIVVNIGDWKEKQEEHLLALADQAAARVRSTGQLQRLYNLNPTQRRVIHLHFVEDPEISSESEGEGEERHLVLKPRSN